MSAYAALKDNSTMSSIFHEGSDNNNEDEDEGLLQYQQNSSDENEEEEQPDENEIPTANTVEIPSRQQIIPTPPPIRSSKLPTQSRFLPDDDNLIFSDDGESIIIGLKVNEYIIIQGQCKLIIERGAIMFNRCHYMTACPETKYDIIALQSQSLPMISSTQVMDRSVGIRDTKTAENEHLFSSDYKSVIRLMNYRTGLENIGKYYSPFKRLVFNGGLGDDGNDLESLEPPSLFENYSFEIILKEKSGIVGLAIDKSWSNKITELTSDNSKEPKIIMVIGNKNTGKSTFSKTLLTSFQLDPSSNPSPISYLDLDPGQSEFSYPYSLSLCEFSSTHPNLATSFPFTTTITDRHDHYFGYTSPVHLPDHYIAIIKQLFHIYVTEHKPRGNRLIINTPGWIKGYGKQLLIEITDFIKPDMLILLSNFVDRDHGDNVDICAGLSFGELEVLQGMYQSPKYSAAQIRILNKLTYFHYRQGVFEFEKHLLDQSPLRVSYETIGDGSGFSGINAVSVLNHTQGYDFNYEDLLTLIESTILGIYAIEDELYQSIKIDLHSEPKHDTYPKYLDPGALLEILHTNDINKVKYLGLLILHSINKLERYMNVYVSDLVLDNIKEYVESGYKLVLVRGEGELPSIEVLNPELVSQQVKSMKRKRKRIKAGKNDDSDDIFTMPYVSFEAKSKVGGVWKARRNVMRRSHQRS
ncbi:GRC3 [[Candida] subhashii]|uniref:GRC3 n=1 Tax=[Candida] subhashii TaxID=561895 RepID=A0A8J5QFC0_9ASCO|nr:GRC3 [[Candida] subhashii]KAG7661014.1 GRC3 [[Candida] subhashii]